jgi:hypothetical protein
MPSPLGALRKNAAYAYVVVGVVWLAIAYYEQSALLLWPVAVMAAGGVLLKVRPGERLTWAWATSAAVLGLVLALYQAYVATTVLTEQASMMAEVSLPVFALFGVAHVLLAYAGSGTAKKPK